VDLVLEDPAISPLSVLVRLHLTAALLVALAVTEDLVDFAELVRFGSRDELTSAAYWRGGLYCGTAEAEVWRAVGY